MAGPASRGSDTNYREPPGNIEYHLTKRRRLRTNLPRIGLDPLAVVVPGIGGSNPQTQAVLGVTEFLSITCSPAPNNETCYAVGLGRNGANGGVVMVSIPFGNIAASKVYLIEMNITYIAVACPSTSAFYALGAQLIGNNVVGYKDVGVLAAYTISTIETPVVQLIQEVTGLIAIGCSSSSNCYALVTPQGQAGEDFPNEGAVVPITNGTAATTAQLYNALATFLGGIGCPAARLV